MVCRQTRRLVFRNTALKGSFAPGGLISRKRGENPPWTAGKPQKLLIIYSRLSIYFKKIEEKKYETELIERGIKTYKKLAVVFNGKDVTIREK